MKNNLKGREKTRDTKHEDRNTKNRIPRKRPIRQLRARRGETSNSETRTADKESLTQLEFTTVLPSSEGCITLRHSKRRLSIKLRRNVCLHRKNTSRLSGGRVVAQPSSPITPFHPRERSRGSVLHESRLIVADDSIARLLLTLTF